ncbi:unnamed protein product [Caenorhabditis auriculariae]|uniref:Major facilitator superfamily (MFS) profile domain-containing protein n=1 Tax=Caenorhabditis auriculariae TaxID=2777116 RepID=A0A8S1HKM6_9PELO|nr:unnamed protein product [Caenorhabditis auriculariae]
MVNRWPSGHMLGVAAVTSLAGSFHFGYQLTMTNPAQDAFLNFLNQTLGARFKDGLSDTTIENIWSFVVAIMFLGALAGSFSIRFIAEKIGRKRGLYISIGAGVISCLMAIGSKYVSLFELFIVSRILMGWSVSVNLGLSAIFLSEASPKECRGAIGMVTGTSVQFGTVCGSIVAMPQLLGTDTLWPFIYAVEIVIIVVFAVSLPFLPESPGHGKPKAEEQRLAFNANFYRFPHNLMRQCNDYGTFCELEKTKKCESSAWPCRDPIGSFDVVE